MLKRKCSKCGKEKSLDGFYRNKSKNHRKDNRESECKECKRGRHRKDYLKYPIKYFLRAAKSRAKKLGIPFDLTVEDIDMPEICPVFKKPFVYGEGKQNDFSISIDRINNSEGYTKGNVIIISWLANRIKSNATKEQLKTLSDFYNNLEIK